MKTNTIYQMVISGVLTGIAIIIGAFGHFSFFGEVYLVGLIVFLMPLFLRIDFLLISTIISVTMSDLISGYGYYAWMSAIVYSLAVIVLYLFSKLRFKFIYIIGLIIASAIIIGGYFVLETITFGLSFAMKDLVSTSLEMSISVVAVSILYFPMKRISKSIRK